MSPRVRRPGLRPGGGLSASRQLVLSPRHDDGAGHGQLLVRVAAAGGSESGQVSGTGGVTANGGRRPQCHQHHVVRARLDAFSKRCEQEPRSARTASVHRESVPAPALQALVSAERVRELADQARGAASP